MVLVGALLELEGKEIVRGVYGVMFYVVLSTVLWITSYFFMLKRLNMCLVELRVYARDRRCLLPIESSCQPTSSHTIFVSRLTSI